MVILRRTLILAVFVVISTAGWTFAADREIWEIQGSGMSSPDEGQTVTTRNNVVTAVARDGFFIQCPDDRADGDPWTSDGILVVTSGTPAVSVGDLVDVTGPVRENYGQTEIAGQPQVTVHRSGEPLPRIVDFDSGVPTSLQPWPETELERFEGMRVGVRSGTVSAPTDGFGEACVTATARRLFREPGILYPGLPGLAVWDGNPEGFELDPFGLGDDGAELAAGQGFSADGVLAFGFGAYQLWTTRLETDTEHEVGRAVRQRVAGEATVATQNLYRLGDPGDSVRYSTRLEKSSRQIREVLGSPNVVAVQEVFDLATLEDLADQISEDDPAVGYTAYLEEGNDPGGIDVGFLVKDGVTVEEAEPIGGGELFSWDGSPLFDRPPLVLRVVLPLASQRLELTLVVVHLRSLGGIDDPDDGDRVRQKRHEQGQWLAGWIQDRQDMDPLESLMILGDFNAFEFSDGYVDVIGQITGLPDPDGALLAAGEDVEPVLRDWVVGLPARERYSFVFGCSAEVLDHIITNPAASGWVREVEFARGNADAPRGFDVDATTPLRSSDHDGLVAFLGPRVRSGGGPRVLATAMTQKLSPIPR